MCPHRGLHGTAYASTILLEISCGSTQNADVSRELSNDISPGLDVTMGEAENNRKRGADVTDPAASVIKPPATDSSGKLLMLPAPETPVSPLTKQETKRNKTGGMTSDKNSGKNNTGNKSTDARLAGPHVGSRPA